MSGRDRSRGVEAAGGPWAALRRLTPARVAIGRSGPSWTTRALLDFQLAHARARDAVHLPLDAGRLAADLRASGFPPPVVVRSAVPDRATYLARPDLGRRLDPACAAALDAAPRSELAVVALDGLSAPAAQEHAVPLLQALRARAPERWSSATIAVALQGRVALGDEIGARLGARLAVVLVGERPGLSSPDSLGVYLTHAPRPGRTDAERNCVSNVRPAGMGYAEAARRVDWLAAEALRRGLTGVGLKDDSDGALAAGVPPPRLGG